MERPPLSDRAVSQAAQRLTDEFTTGALQVPTLEQTQRLVANVAARLRAVCAQLDDDAFAELVVDIVRVKLRDEVRDRTAAAESLDRAVVERVARDMDRQRRQGTGDAEATA